MSQTLPQLAHGTDRAFKAWMDAQDLEPMLAKVRPLVMPPVSVEALVDIANVALVVLASDIPGDFVQCGVWRGGTGFLLAEMLRQAGVRDRRVWLFDSFEGMPPVQAIDGPRAIADASDPRHPLHAANCPVPIEEVQRTARELGLSAHCELVKGWFDQTLPAWRTRIGPVALLHLDCDWHASVRCCLENLYDAVVEGGFVLLDDYYGYDGCTLAVHEFLAARGLAHRIESVVGRWGGCEHNVAARVRKGATNWQMDHLLHLAREDLAAVIPPGGTVSLVDDALFGASIAPGCRVVPFLERGGHYWGVPSDDGLAVREAERARRSGSAFLVFAWPAFWWLEHYAGFHDHLVARFPCVLRNDRVVVFDLQGGVP